MATAYLSPGVYVEEVDRGAKPIEGVGTAVAAFIGFTDRAEELAALMTPVFGEVDADRLRGHAAWIAGGEGQS